MIIPRYPLLLIFIGFIAAQEEQQENPTFSDFQISSERYMTDANGNILMYVNVWGQVGSPGHILVYEGIDMATLISIVGGPSSGANMKKVKLYRELPDDDGQIIYNLNFNNFIKSGDRSDFIKIKPNDTIIIPQTNFSYFLNQVGTFNTFLGLLNLYFQVSRSFAD